MSACLALGACSDDSDSNDGDTKSDASTNKPDGGSTLTDAATNIDSGTGTMDATVAADASSPGNDAAASTLVDAGGGAQLNVVALSPSGHDRFYGVAYDAAGNIYAVGQYLTGIGAMDDISTVIAKFTSAGVLDPKFGSNGFTVVNVAAGTNGELLRGITVQSTGKIVAAGTVEHAGATDARDRDVAVLRLNADGSRDMTFGTNGIATFDLSAGVVVNPSVDGGTTTFVADSAWGLARYADDRLVISGGKVRDNATDTDFVLLRLTKDGLADESFGTKGVFALDTQIDGKSNNASPRNVTILPGTDGVIGAGYQPIPGADTGPVVYKVTNDGVLDTTFGVNGVFSERPLEEQAESYEAVVQPAASGSDYKLVTTGYGRALSTETTDILSLRLTSTGQLDTTYAKDGVMRLDVGGFGDNSRRLVVLPDRRILEVGGGRPTKDNVDGLAVVLTADGVLDTTFGPNGFRTYDLGGAADFLWSVTLSPDQKTAAAVGIKSAGTTAPAPANDDAVLLLLPVPMK